MLPAIGAALPAIGIAMLPPVPIGIAVLPPVPIGVIVLVGGGIICTGGAMFPAIPAGGAVTIIPVTGGVTLGIDPVLVPAPSSPPHPSASSANAPPTLATQLVRCIGPVLSSRCTRRPSP